MAENDILRQAVERVVAETLANAQSGIVARVLEAVGEAQQQRTSSNGNSGRIAAALRCIEAVTSQSDVLRALLDGCASLSQRCALFVLRGNTGVVWQAKGFDETFRSQVLDVQSGSPAEAISTRRAVAGNASELGLGNAVFALVPLVIRDRVAALLYADAGAEEVDAAAIEILVRNAGYWIELSAARGPVATPQQPQRPSDPPPAAVPTSVKPVQQPSHFGVSAAATPTVQATTPTVHPQPSGPDDELHRKARRFAKLLVDEIKLYNAAKVTAGRLHGDLYDRLKEDIEKSRDAFNRRYGATAAAEMDYFTQELVRGLADGNASLLGVLK